MYFLAQKLGKAVSIANHESQVRLPSLLSTHKIQSGPTSTHSVMNSTVGNERMIRVAFNIQGHHKPS